MPAPSERGISNTPQERILAVRRGLREQPGFVHPTWAMADRFMQEAGMLVDNPGGTYHGWVFSPSVFELHRPLKLGKDFASFHLRRAPGQNPGEFKEEIELSASISRPGVRREHNMHWEYALNKQGVKTREGAGLMEAEQAAVADIVGAVILIRR